MIITTLAGAKPDAWFLSAQTDRPWWDDSLPLRKRLSRALIPILGPLLPVYTLVGLFFLLLIILELIHMVRYLIGLG